MTGQPNRPAIDTLTVHAGEPQPRIAGAVSMPVFQSATFEPDPGADYHDLKYIRLNNTPNHVALHAKIAALEGAQSALVTASGMAAITATLLTFLRADDHLLAQRCLYGGTHGFVTEDLGRYGIDHDFIDAQKPSDWEAKLRPETRVIYVETLTNPLLEVADLEAVTDFARTHELVSVIDNTFASPVNYRPEEHGFDLSLHSATKYLNGHSDIVAGVVIGCTDHVAAVKMLLDHLGGSLDPHACGLLHRGLKTLALRVRLQNDNALALARMLAGHPAIARVNYTGLETHPQHARAARLFEGGGGVLSFEPHGGVDAALRIIKRVRLPIDAPSLGGVESLITRPAATSHAGIAPRERQALGISDALVRVAVGIEDPRDLLADFEQALAGL